MKNQEESRRIKLSKILFALLAVLFSVSVAAQVFLAGLAIFVNPIHWLKHTGFVHIFEFIPVLMLIICFVGRLPRWAIGQSAALFGVIFVMYFTANVTTVFPWVAALHPVIAIGLFWMSVKIVPKAWNLAFNPSSEGEVA